MAAVGAKLPRALARCKLVGRDFWVANFSPIWLTHARDFRVSIEERVRREPLETCEGVFVAHRGGPRRNLQKNGDDAVARWDRLARFGGVAVGRGQHANLTGGCGRSGSEVGSGSRGCAALPVGTETAGSDGPSGWSGAADLAVGRKQIGSRTHSEC